MTYITAAHALQEKLEKSFRSFSQASFAETFHKLYKKDTGDAMGEVSAEDGYISCRDSYVKGSFQ